MADNQISAEAAAAAIRALLEAGTSREDIPGNLAHGWPLVDQPEGAEAGPGPMPARVGVVPL